MPTSSRSFRRRTLVLALAALCCGGAAVAANATGNDDPGRAVALQKHKNRAARSKPTERVSKQALRARQLRERLPREFTVVVQEPFVVIGDGPAADVRAIASNTVGWAVAKLKKEYFPSDPQRVLEIWVFRNAESYESNTWKFWRTRPGTPYGYYSSADGVLVMNIATGGGTLVHELVHPFIEQNFPGAPAWFNEGLGSLYEQAAEREGRIVGLTNWRLAGLQDALRNGSVPSFRTLTATTTQQFYGEDPGTNYAQARYLLYYLQERGLLSAFYRQFIRNHHQDPTGYETLRSILGRPDMKTFAQQWKAYVLALRFR